MRDAMTVRAMESVMLHVDSHTIRDGYFLGVVQGGIHWTNLIDFKVVPVGGGFPNVTDRNGCVLGLEQPEPFLD